MFGPPKKFGDEVKNTPPVTPVQEARENLVKTTQERISDELTELKNELTRVENDRAQPKGRFSMPKIIAKRQLNKKLKKIDVPLMKLGQELIELF